jgi:DNA-binding CsgD family transcriptional regulator
MTTEAQDYSLFFKFIKAYQPTGFKGIDRTDTLMVQLEKLMEHNDQFFYMADIIQMKVIFCSERSTQMIGISPEEVTPYHFMEATHPDDIQRLNLGRAKLIGRAQDLFIAKKGEVLISTNFRIRNSTGSYSNFLIQSYLFYAAEPYNTVWFLKVHTNIDWSKKIKHGFHYYIGYDLSNFKFPDDEFLSKGNVFSSREFQIIRLIESGLSTERIAEKLFLSPLTVNTHRANILEKTGKSHISDLIYDLKERGLL